jgi:hypothetical protein
MNSKTLLILFVFASVLLPFLGRAQQLQYPTAVSANSNTMVASSPDSRGWTDPALNHNRLLQQKNGDGVYKMVGSYKVIGNCFLFGEHLTADIISSTEKGYNIFINYNTYNQEVEFYSTNNPDKPLVKSPGELDSFIMHKNSDVGIEKDLKFIYGSLLNTKDKAYYEELYQGTRYSLYKKYRSELNFVSTNYVQSDLRQFDLEYDYYYYDNQTKELKKLKKNAASIIKEFKSFKDVSSVMTNEAFSANPEDALRKAFDILNN